MPGCLGLKLPDLILHPLNHLGLFGHLKVELLFPLPILPLKRDCLRRMGCLCLVLLVSVHHGLCLSRDSTRGRPGCLGWLCGSGCLS